MLGRPLVAALASAVLSSCGGVVAEPPEECGSGASCARLGGDGLRLDRAAAPDGEATVALPTQVVAAAGDVVEVRVEFADLCQDLVGVHVEQTPEQVTLTGVGTPMSNPCRLRAAIVSGTVQLEEPLGSRRVEVVRSRW